MTKSEHVSVREVILADVGDRYVRQAILSWWWLIFCAVSAMVCGCPHINSGLPPHLRMPVLEESSPAEGSYHKVQTGETLEEIAARYDVDPQYLAEINNLEAPYVLTEKAEIFVPKSSRPSSNGEAHVLQPVRTPVAEQKGEIIWPVEGKVVSGFGIKGGVQRNGISIEAANGAPVLAAKDGTVGHVGAIPGYGNVILIEHPNRLVTVYAHLKDTRVSPGAAVKQGTIIATVGNSGRADKPQLYFEVRSKSKPRNPLFFLKKTS